MLGSFRSCLVMFGALVLVAPDVVPAQQAARAAVPQRLVFRADDGHALTVWRMGARAGARPRGPILLLHGRTWSSLPNFDLHVGARSHSLMRRFADAGYTVFAADQRGYGATPRDSSGWLTPDRAAADVAMILDSISGRMRGAPKPVVIGYSQGTRYGALAAMRHPDKVRALVMYGFAVDVTAAERRTSGAAAPEAVVPPRRRTTREGAAADFITPESTPAGVKEAYVVAATTADSIRADWRNEEQFDAIDPGALGVPVMILAGERDPVTNGARPDAFWVRLRAVDRAWVVLARTDHVLHLQKQAAFVAAVRGFVER